MKFALIALVATVASIRMTSLVQSQCVSMGTSDHVFSLVDSDDSGLISGDELMRALQEVRGPNHKELPEQV